MVALLVLSALAPPVGPTALGARTGVLVLGVAIVVVGFADHVRLVRTVRLVPND